MVWVKGRYLHTRKDKDFNVYIWSFTRYVCMSMTSDLIVGKRVGHYIKELTDYDKEQLDELCLPYVNKLPPKFAELECQCWDCRNPAIDNFNEISINIF